jgi:autotransporter-associated beta strand protein
LIKTGVGKLILSGANTYNGGTTVSQGLLDLGNIALGFGSGRDISASTGVIIMRTALSNTFLNRLVENSNEFGLYTGTTGNNLDFSSSTGANLPNAFLGFYVGNGGAVDYSGIITPASDAYRLGYPINNGNLGISRAHGDVGGTKGLIVGGGRVVLIRANTFTGDTTIRSGLLSLAHVQALQNSALDVGSSGGSFACESAACTMIGFGGSAITVPTLGGLKGSRNLLSVYNGGILNNSSPLAATSVAGFTLNLGTGVTCTYTGAIADFAPQTTITKIGTGTQILSGVNTYTGPTTISAGTLEIGGAGVLGNGIYAASIDNSATLRFNSSAVQTLSGIISGG